ncbi:MAG: hypothetical protein KJZ96_03260 [Rhodocyclaceae bacterium]|nr:hypothetical protein [Rhodocyclaceae bacterium]
MGRTKKILVTRERDDKLGTFSCRVPRQLLDDLTALRAAAAQAGLDLPIQDLIVETIRSVVRAGWRELQNSPPSPSTMVDGDGDGFIAEEHGNES